ncbi:MAG: DUF1080 domain-containing protein [Pirellulaceae bacterium]|nr:DUF1080 domain-containing protein [Pirellulaceae bacterium]
MRFLCTFVALAFIATCLPSPIGHAKEGDGFVSLFDGESLEGWSGNPKFWSIQDGAITGITTKDNPTDGNTFCIYKDEFDGNFELVFDFRIEGHNSGVQYRSFRLEDGADEWRIGGYQADMDAAKQWVGTLYGEKFRGILAKRGEKVILGAGDAPKKGGLARKVESLGDPEELGKKVHDYPDWNTFRVVVKGYHMQHYINDTLMIDCTDRDKDNRRNEGLIALQLHGGPPMKVQFKNIKIKKLGKPKANKK